MNILMLDISGKVTKYTFWVNENESDRYVGLKGFANGAKLRKHK